MSVEVCGEIKERADRCKDVMLPYVGRGAEDSDCRYGLVSQVGAVTCTMLADNRATVIYRRLEVCGEKNHVMGHSKWSNRIRKLALDRVIDDVFESIYTS